MWQRKTCTGVCGERSRSRSKNWNSTQILKKRHTFVDWDDVGDTITRVNHNSGEQTLCVQSEHGLHSNVDSLELECLKHLFHQPLSVLHRVHRRFGQQHLAVLRVDLKLLPCVPAQVHKCTMLALLDVRVGVGESGRGEGCTALYTKHDTYCQTRRMSSQLRTIPLSIG
jgi:hypothetical protein